MELAHLKNINIVFFFFLAVNKLKTNKMEIIFIYILFLFHLVIYHSIYLKLTRLNYLI